MSDRPAAYDEHDHFLCSCKGLPYTRKEWHAEVARLDAALKDARHRQVQAVIHGVCLPARFDGQEPDA